MIFHIHLSHYIWTVVCKFILYISVSSTFSILGPGPVIHLECTLNIKGLCTARSKRRWEKNLNWSEQTGNGRYRVSIQLLESACSSDRPSVRSSVRPEKIPHHGHMHHSSGSRIIDICIIYICIIHTYIRIKDHTYLHRGYMHHANIRWDQGS